MKYTLANILILTATLASGQRPSGFEQKKKVKTDISVPEYSIINGQGLSNSDTKGTKFNRPDTSGRKELNVLEDWKIQRQDGKPVFINYYYSGSGSNVNQLQFAANALKGLKSLSGCDPAFVFQLSEKNRMDQLRYKQLYQGMEVYGAEVVVNFDSNGNLKTLNGNYSDCPEVPSLKFHIHQLHAIQIAQKHLESITAILNPVDKPLPVASKILYSENFIEELQPAWKVDVWTSNIHEWTVIIDALHGEVIKSFHQTCSVTGDTTALANDLAGITRTLNTYYDGGQFFLKDISKPMYDSAVDKGYIMTYDAMNTAGVSFQEFVTPDNVWNDSSSVSAHFNASEVYDFFYNEYGRNSFDDDGGNIVSFVNVSDDFGNGMDNAYWDGQNIYYGNGDQIFTPLAEALDVAGHEMTHGVIQHTANLEYYGESGAINESMADIFGFMMDTLDWKMGEDITSSSFVATGALRDLSDPHNGGSSLSDNGWQPKHMNEKYIGPLDNAGVHINSGIPNYAFYLLATEIGKKEAAELFYNALTNYLTRSSRFIDLRLAVLQSASDVYGDSSAVWYNVGEAFDSVGIYNGVATVVEHELPINPGNDYMIFKDVNTFDLNTVYRMNPLGGGFYAYSQTPVGNRPSVTDDGEFAVFVGEDHRIYKLTLSDSSNPVETVLENDTIWASVAISKDGNKLAMTSVDTDSSIYVRNLQTDELRRFMLYNPTYADGVEAGAPQFADALEWNYNGEYITYDAFNTIENVNGDNLEYWDVGIIRVWNDTTNDFSTGTIQKLFAGLPENVSIGNPSFSKNSSNIMVLDYSEVTAGGYIFGVMGYDMETNTTSIISWANTISWPSYSKLDDLVAFTFYEADFTYSIAVIGVNPDKITPSTAATRLVELAQYGVYYTNGVRVTDDPVVLNNSISSVETGVDMFPNPVSNTINIYSDKKLLTIEFYNSLSQRIILPCILTNDGLHAFNTSELSTGVYYVHLNSGDKVEVKKFVKQ